MKVMMMRRVLLQEAGYHQRNPCVHKALRNLTNVAAQNASMEACRHVFTHLHAHHGGSPIPYLLAGLAAMLALIAISLVILACSYWKLVGCVEQQAARAYAGSNSSGVSHSQNNTHMSNNMSVGGERFITPHEMSEASNKLAVIMAGHDKPTFLAQPVGLVDSSCSCTVPASSLKA